MTEQEKREKVTDLLYELSQSLDTLQDSNTRNRYISQLESIYSGIGDEHFRHYYSDIFSCLTMIDSDPMSNLEILAENIKILKEDYVPTRGYDGEVLIDVSKELNKLYDHTNLDIARINYNKKMYGETQSELAVVKGLISNLKKDLQESEKKRAEGIENIKLESENLKKEVHNTQQNMQNEYITILGIFAAIVLAFTGGMTFSTSALEKIDAISPYRLATVVLIIGLVLINLIWILLDFIRSINGSSIRRWWFILLANGILFGGLLVNLLAFKLHWFDNNMITTEQTVQEESAVMNATLSMENINQDIK